MIWLTIFALCTSHVTGDTPDPAILLSAMTLDEKISMLHGHEGETDYVGFVPGNERLRIPPLNMNDGPQGFRTQTDGMEGTTTQFPSALAIASTFDVELAASWARAMGREFAGKGSNVQLGPGLNVARIPVNGRNFEYLSGEDPYLGAILAGPVVAGIQTEGVIANAKHYINNNQEYDRTSVIAALDERTQMETYMPPFRAAIKAGVGSVMCAYNNISTAAQQARGESFWSCENPETLMKLKDPLFLGFEGWVMSDWGATHSTAAAAAAGLDQEMGGEEYFSPELLKQALDTGTVTEEMIDDKVFRILTKMIQLGIFDEDAAWRRGNLTNDVTNEEHYDLARSLAAASQILIKNDGLLPLSEDISSVAVIGDAAGLLGIYGGGGSGAVAPKQPVSVLEGVLREFGVDLNRTANCTLQYDVDYFQPSGNVLLNTEDVQGCCAACAATIGCNNFAFVEGDGSCWLKPNDAGEMESPGIVAGACPKFDTGGKVTFSPTADSGAAAAAAAAADVALVVVATTSSEGADRETLAFDDASLALVSAVGAAAGSKMAVIAVTPGAAVLPFQHDAAAVVLSIMPGERHGQGLADVLWGRINPSARSPVTIPNRDNEVEFTVEQYPGVGEGPVSTYTEQLLVGYKWYLANDVVPLACFGHGLSYTNFNYTDLSINVPKSGDVRVTATVTNVGKVYGEDVVQLYIMFPEESGEPIVPQLRNFTKVKLDPGKSASFSFVLDAEALSVWDDQETHGIVEQSGTFVVSLGPSSCDLRLIGAFENSLSASA